jgi:hypothetical protein
MRLWVKSSADLHCAMVTSTIGWRNILFTWGSGCAVRSTQINLVGFQSLVVYLSRINAIYRLPSVSQYPAVQRCNLEAEVSNNVTVISQTGMLQRPNLAFGAHKRLVGR